MNIALVGMPPRESAAMTIFMGVALKGWSTQSVAAQAGGSLPLADLYVVDLAGIGLDQWSVKAEGDLLRLLAGRHALLLVAANNTTWGDKLASHEWQKLVCLHKPCKTQALREALLRCTPQEASLTPGHEVPLSLVAAPRLAPAPSAALGAHAGPAAASGASVSDSMRALQLLFPTLHEHLLLSTLLRLVALETPHELRLSVHHAIVMHPTQGWVAHNATPDLLERLSRDGSAVRSMSVRPLAGVEVLQCVRRMGVSSGSLDTFLWHMADLSMGAKTPCAQGNAELHLRAMPGFTRIPDARNLYVQLAAICVRLPQTLASLKAAFSQHDPCDIERFMLLSTASGLGRLRLLSTATPTLSGRAPPVPAARPARAGFMRSLLSKLL